MLLLRSKQVCDRQRLDFGRLMLENMRLPTERDPRCISWEISNNGTNRIAVSEVPR